MNRLQKALGVNAIFSGFSGIGLIFFHKSIANVFGLEQSTAFWIIGIGLVLFASTILLEVKKQRRLAIKWIIIQDFIWVIASAFLLVVQPFNISSSGNYTIAIIALIVLLMAFDQLRALAQTKNQNGKGSMPSIKTEIVINAPVENVWKILMDHEAYPRWNSFIKKISGNSEVGSALVVTLQSPGNSPMNFKPIVLVNNPNQEFRWIGKLGIKGVFDGEHYFLLEQIGTNQTKFIHGEHFTGLLAGVLMKMIGKDTESGFRAMNDALKLRVEGVAT